MNESIFFFFYNFAHQSQIFDNIIIFFAVYFPFIVLILAEIFLYRRLSRNLSPQVLGFFQKWEEIITVFFSVFLAYVFASILKLIIEIDRSFVQFGDILPLFNPNQEYSFPSTHAAIFSALALSIFFLHKKTGLIFAFFALLISFARIIAGVHFPIDILGGFILGSFVGTLVAYFVKNVYPHT